MANIWQDYGDRKTVDMLNGGELQSFILEMELGLIGVSYAGEGNLIAILAERGMKKGMMMSKLRTLADIFREAFQELIGVKNLRERDDHVMKIRRS